MTKPPSLHVLIVDDDTPSVQLLECFFQGTDHRITVTASGGEVLPLLQKDRFDLIISDIEKLGGEGLQLIREALSRFPLLFFMGTIDGGCSIAPEAVIKAGALTCLVKPVRRSDVMDIVDWVASLKNEATLTSAEGLSPLEGGQAVQIEKMLWNRDQRFQAVMNAAADAVILVDHDGNIGCWNPAAELMFGYEFREVVGKMFHSLIIPPKFRAKAQMGFKKFITVGRDPAGGDPIELIGLRKDQTRFPALVSLSRFKSGGGWHAAGIFRDLSARKQHQRTLFAARLELGRADNRLSQQSEIADKVFNNLVRKNEKIEKNIRYFLSAMDVSGGDLFLSASADPGVRHLLLGDFTGRGLPTTLGAIPVTSLFYDMAEEGYSQRNIAIAINNRLKAVLPTGLFFCGCMVEWDYTHHIVRVLNFGLPPALVVGADGVVKSTLPSQHLPLGILAEIDRGCRNVEVRLSDGDCLYFYTDGITKARNKFGEQFGEKRLHPLLTRQDVSEHRFDEIRRSIDEFRGDTPQWDDMAFVEIRCDATAEPHPAEEKKSGCVDLSAVLDLSLTFHPDAMRSDNVINTLTDLLAGTHLAVRNQKQNIFLILSELYTNALEHGILRIDANLKNEPGGFERYILSRQEKLVALASGWIKIDLKMFVRDASGKIEFHIEDSGQGFDYQNELITEPDLTSPRGRGVYLVRSLCREFVIEGKGNASTAIFEW